MTRPHVVHQLVDAALAGMSSVADGTTADEVYTAQMAMAHNAVRCGVERGVSKAHFRNALMLILMLCAEDTVQ